MHVKKTDKYHPNNKKGFHKYKHFHNVNINKNPINILFYS